MFHHYLLSMHTKKQLFVLFPSGDFKVNICGGNEMYHFDAPPRKPQIENPASMKRLKVVTHLSTEDGPLK